MKSPHNQFQERVAHVQLSVLKELGSVNFLLALKDLPSVPESGLNDQRIFDADAKKSADIGDKVFGDHKF